MADGPHWDPSRRLYYYIDRSREPNQRVYETGERIDIPRATAQEAARETVQNPDRNRTETPQRASHRSYSQSSRDAYTTSTTRQSEAPDLLDVNELSASIEARNLTFGLRNVQPGRHQNPEAQLYETNNNGFRVITVVDPTTGVQTAYANSPNSITDPAVGATARRFLLPTPGETERLHASYSIRRPGWRWFVEGRVFRILWVEPAGNTSDESLTIASGREPIDDHPEIFPGRYGERVFSKVRGFVVIREATNYCTALAINSYGYRGVGKPGVNKSEHTIIHTSPTPPPPMDIEAPERGEEGMRSQPIRVVPDVRTESLDPRSRLDFGKVYTIHHNVKVKPLGMVHESCMDSLKSQFQNVFNQSARDARLARTGAARSSASTGLAQQPQATGHVGSSAHGQVGRGSQRAPQSSSRPGSARQQQAVRNSVGTHAAASSSQVTPRTVPSATEHQQAVATYAAYQRLIHNSQHTATQALQVMIQALQRHQTTLSDTAAEQIIRGQLRYADTLARARVPGQAGSETAYQSRNAGLADENRDRGDSGGGDDRESREEGSDEHAESDDDDDDKGVGSGDEN